MTVMGYPAVNGVVNTNAPLTAINIPLSGQVQQPEATTTFSMTANLDSASPIGTTLSRADHAIRFAGSELPGDGELYEDGNQHLVLRHYGARYGDGGSSHGCCGNDHGRAGVHANCDCRDHSRAGGSGGSGNIYQHPYAVFERGFRGGHNNLQLQLRLRAERWMATATLSINGQAVAIPGAGETVCCVAGTGQCAGTLLAYRPV